MSATDFNSLKSQLDAAYTQAQKAFENVTKAGSLPKGQKVVDLTKDQETAVEELGQKIHAVTEEIKKKSSANVPGGAQEALFKACNLLDRLKIEYKIVPWKRVKGFEGFVKGICWLFGWKILAQEDKPVNTSGVKGHIARAVQEAAKKALGSEKALKNEDVTVRVEVDKKTGESSLKMWVGKIQGLGQDVSWDSGNLKVRQNFNDVIFSFSGQKVESSGAPTVSVSVSKAAFDTAKQDVGKKIDKDSEITDQDRASMHKWLSKEELKGCYWFGGGGLLAQTGQEYAITRFVKKWSSKASTRVGVTAGTQQFTINYIDKAGAKKSCPGFFDDQTAALKVTIGQKKIEARDFATFEREVKNQIKNEAGGVELKPSEEVAKLAQARLTTANPALAFVQGLVRDDAKGLLKEIKTTLKADEAAFYCSAVKDDPFSFNVHQINANSSRPEENAFTIDLREVPGNLVITQKNGSKKTIDATEEALKEHLRGQSAKTAKLPKDWGKIAGEASPAVGQVEARIKTQTQYESSLWHPFTGFKPTEEFLSEKAKVLGSGANGAYYLDAIQNGKVTVHYVKDGKLSSAKIDLQTTAGKFKVNGQDYDAIDDALQAVCGCKPLTLPEMKGREKSMKALIDSVKAHKDYKWEGGERVAELLKLFGSTNQASGWSISEDQNKKLQVERYGTGAQTLPIEVSFDENGEKWKLKAQGKEAENIQDLLDQLGLQEKDGIYALEKMEIGRQGVLEGVQTYKTNHAYYGTKPEVERLLKVFASEGQKSGWLLTGPDEGPFTVEKCGEGATTIALSFVYNRDSQEWKVRGEDKEATNIQGLLQALGLDGNSDIKALSRRENERKSTQAQIEKLKENRNAVFVPDAKDLQKLKAEIERQTIDTYCLCKDKDGKYFLYGRLEGRFISQDVSLVFENDKYTAKIGNRLLESFIKDLPGSSLSYLRTLGTYVKEGSAPPPPVTAVKPSQVTTATESVEKLQKQTFQTLEEWKVDGKNVLVKNPPSNIEQLAKNAFANTREVVFWFTRNGDVFTQHVVTQDGLISTQLKFDFAKKDTPFEMRGTGGMPKFVNFEGFRKSWEDMSAIPFAAFTEDEKADPTEAKKKETLKALAEWKDPNGKSVVIEKPQQTIVQQANNAVSKTGKMVYWLTKGEKETFELHYIKAKSNKEWVLKLRFNPENLEEPLLQQIGTGTEVSIKLETLARFVRSGRSFNSLTKEETTSPSVPPSALKEKPAPATKEKKEATALEPPSWMTKDDEWRGIVSEVNLKSSDTSKWLEKFNETAKKTVFKPVDLYVLAYVGICSQTPGKRTLNTQTIREEIKENLQSIIKTKLSLPQCCYLHALLSGNWVSYSAKGTVVITQICEQAIQDKFKEEGLRQAKEFSARVH